MKLRIPGSRGALLAGICVMAAVSASGAGKLLDEAADDFYNLDFERALTIYEQASSANPNDAEIHNHLAHTLLYRELFRNGALESEMVTGNNSFIRRAKFEVPAEVDRRFATEVERAMALSQTLLAKNSRDTAALHALAVSYALRANYGFFVKKTWMASLSDSTKAHKLDTQVTDIDPANYDARLLQGGYDYIIGSLPWSWRMLGFVGGFHGDKLRGINTIAEVTKKGKDNKSDAEMTLCALYRREGQTTRAIPLVVELIQRFPRNYLLRFELAQMYGATGQRKEAIETLNEIAKRKRENVPGFGRIPWEKIYYETGNLQFWFNDLDPALENLKRVTATPEQLKEIDLNTGVLALMRQGQIYDLQNRHAEAVKIYQQAMQFAPEAEAAKESRNYIGAPYKRQRKS
jgi:tetratricopeptide (TPR) repeat protein